MRKELDTKANANSGPISEIGLIFSVLYNTSVFIVVVTYPLLVNNMFGLFDLQSSVLKVYEIMKKKLIASAHLNIYFKATYSTAKKFRQADAT